MIGVNPFKRREQPLSAPPTSPLQRQQPENPYPSLIPQAQPVQQVAPQRPQQQNVLQQGVAPSIGGTLPTASSLRTSFAGAGPSDPGPGGPVPPLPEITSKPCVCSNNKMGIKICQTINGNETCGECQCGGGNPQGPPPEESGCTPQQTQSWNDCQRAGDTVVVGEDGCFSRCEDNPDEELGDDEERGDTTGCVENHRDACVCPDAKTVGMIGCNGSCGPCVPEDRETSSDISLRGVHDRIRRQGNAWNNLNMDWLRDAYPEGVARRQELSDRADSFIRGDYDVNYHDIFGPKNPLEQARDIWNLRDRFGPAERTYQEFADTGGFTDRDKGLFRARATSGVPAIENLLMRRDDRMSDSANERQIGRDFTRLLNEQRIGTESSLAEQIRSGRLSGAEGLFGIGSARTSRDISQAQGTGDLYTNLGREYRGIEEANRERRLAGIEAARRIFGTSDPRSAQLMQNLLQGYNIFGSQEVNLAAIDKEFEGGINWPAILQGAATAATFL